MYFSLTLTSRKIIIITCLNRMTISVIKTAINMGPVVKRRSSKKLITATVGISRRSHFLTGSRRDVFVVRTSKPVENLWKNGLFWSRYGFVTHSIDRKSRDWGLARSASHFVPRSPFGHPSGDVPCASEDMACGYWFSKVDLGQIRSEEIVYSRFIKIPLG